MHNNVPAKLHNVNGKKQNDARELKSQNIAFLTTIPTHSPREFGFRNVKLLSFGDDEGAEDEDGEAIVQKKKDIARPDC